MDEVRDRTYKSVVLVLLQLQIRSGAVGLLNDQFGLQGFGEANAFLSHRFLLADVRLRLILAIKTYNRLRPQGSQVAG
jgi:hypothetical protein